MPNPQTESGHRQCASVRHATQAPVVTSQCGRGAVQVGHCSPPSLPPPVFAAIVNVSLFEGAPLRLTVTPFIQPPAGGVPVPFSDLLAPHFYKAPDELFSPDMFHPSAAGYALAAQQLLPALCAALGEFVGTEPAEAALESRSGEGSLLSRIGNLGRLWRRSTGVPAPIVVAAG